MFRDGQVAEQGTHDELIAQDGVYANLVRIQISHPEDPEAVKKREEERKYEQKVCSRRAKKRGC